MIMLYNPTNEDFDTQYAGISMTIHAEERMEVNDPCGNHLLNAFGARGLTQLTYNCDEAKVKEEAIGRNVFFKKKQIIDYNQNNEKRKVMSLSYLPPSKKNKRILY